MGEEIVYCTVLYVGINQLLNYVFGTKFLTAGLEGIGILLRDRTEKNVIVKP